MVMVHGIGDGGAGGSRSKEGGGHDLSEVGSVSLWFELLGVGVPRGI